jgi:uncharacterized membrane protein
MAAYTVDILAVGFFILEWTVYAVTLEHTAYGRDSLSARMHAVDKDQDAFELPQRRRRPEVDRQCAQKPQRLAGRA